MKSNLIYTLLLLIFNSPLAHAQSADIWKPFHSINEYFLSYQEGEKFIVKDLVTPENALQSVKRTWIFSSQRAVQSFLKHHPPLHNAQRLESHQIPNRKTQTEDPNNVIWQATNQWSWDWEIKYSQWVNDNFDTHFFERYNIATDCADVAFSIRWIFSRIYSLPAAQSLAGTGAIFSNESMKAEWAKIPTDKDWYNDQRFLTALIYMLNNTYTHSLFEDSYPIAIRADTLIAGTHFLHLRNPSGHTLFVGRIDQNHQVITDCSDEPQIVRELYEDIFGYSDQPTYVNGATGGGFLKMRWPMKTAAGWALQPMEKMPNFSMEQYAPDFVKNTDQDFSEEIHLRISTDFDVRIFFSSLIDRLQGSLQDRVLVVQEGFAFCSKNDCSENSSNFGSFSTPNRDSNVRDEITSLEKLLANNSNQYPELKAQWKKALKLTFNIDTSHVLNLNQIIQIWKISAFTSDPRDPILKRWGISQ